MPLPWLSFAKTASNVFGDDVYASRDKLDVNTCEEMRVAFISKASPRPRLDIRSVKE